MRREFTCIICPNGCDLTARYEGKAVLDIDGALCPKGADYVRQELTDPRRSIATSIPVEGGDLPLVSVRLDAPIPKDRIFEAMAEIRTLRVRAPTAVGQVVLAQVCGLDSNVIITKPVAAKGDINK